MKSIFRPTFICVLLVFSFSLTAQENYFYNKALIDSLLHDSIYLYENESGVDTVFLNQIKELTRSIERDKGIPSRMFPYSKFDSVKAFRFNKDIPRGLVEYENEKEEDMKWPISLFDENGRLRSDLKYPKGKKLTHLQIKQLLHFINDPRNFEFSYCACANFSIGLIVFYFNGKRIAYITVDSEYLFHCYPRNFRTQAGMLTNRGYDIIPFINKLGIEVFEL